MSSFFGFDLCAIFTAMTTGPRILLESAQLELTLKRLCHQLIENYDDFSQTCLIGVQPRGVRFSDRLHDMLQEIQAGHIPRYGKLDTTFYRDDFREMSAPPEPAATEIDFSVEGQRVVLVDDVLYTGRTIRAAMDALLDYGRPAKVELLTLIDRRFSRHLPIQPDYTGRKVDVILSEKVKVEWDKDGRGQVWIYEQNEKRP